VTSGEADLPRVVTAAADEAASWDTRAGSLSDLSDADLLAARDALIRLVDRLEGLLAAAEAASPLDEELIGVAARALRTARHNEVWAGYVLHQRLPPTDLADLI
jgi:hypothetical protein